MTVQICTEVHTQGNTTSSSSNEAICLEVLGVLRRCFVQQAPVKVCLYQGTFQPNHWLCNLFISLILITAKSIESFYGSIKVKDKH